MKTKINKYGEILCKDCEMYKLVEKFYKRSDGKIRPECISCNLTKKRNKKIIAKNMGKPLQYNKKSWNKHKDRYNIKRKIMRIIGYLDGKGRVKETVTEKQLFKQKVRERKTNLIYYRKNTIKINLRRRTKRKITIILGMNTDK